MRLYGWVLSKKRGTAFCVKASKFHAQYFLRTAWRGLSSTSTVTSPTGLCSAFATASRFCFTGKSRETVDEGTMGPTASLSMYMTGPGSNSEPRAATAITLMAPLRPCKVWWCGSVRREGKEGPPSERDVRGSMPVFARLAAHTLRQPRPLPTQQVCQIHIV